MKIRSKSVHLIVEDAAAVVEVAIETAADDKRIENKQNCLLYNINCDLLFKTALTRKLGRIWKNFEHKSCRGDSPLQLLCSKFFRKSPIFRVIQQIKENNFQGLDRWRGNREVWWNQEMATPRNLPRKWFWFRTNDFTWMSRKTIEDCKFLLITFLSLRFLTEHIYVICRGDSKLQI